MTTTHTLAALLLAAVGLGDDSGIIQPCCLPEACQENVLVLQCLQMDGLPAGAGTSCADPEPPCERVSCCLDTGCVTVSAEECAKLGGEAGPPGSACPMPDVCFTCIGDIDGDEEAGITDLLVLLASYGCPEPGCPGDLDRNGVVTIVDLLILLGAWGPC